MRFSSGATALTVFWMDTAAATNRRRPRAPCGCLVGVYEMWTDGCVEILERPLRQSRRVTPQGEPCPPPGVAGVRGG